MAAHSAGLEYVDLADYTVNSMAAAMLPVDFARRRTVLPLAWEKGVSWSPCPSSTLRTRLRHTAWPCCAKSASSTTDTPGRAGLGRFARFPPIFAKRPRSPACQK